MGIGFVVRDHEGAVMVAMVGSIPHVSDPTTAEDIATLKMVEVCFVMGFFKVILEGDSLETVTALKMEVT
jgi:ribosomal silencing factor RsfS